MLQGVHVILRRVCFCAGLRRQCDRCFTPQHASSVCYCAGLYWQYDSFFTPRHAYAWCAIMLVYNGIVMAFSPHGMHGVLLCWSTLTVWPLASSRCVLLCWVALLLCEGLMLDDPEWDTRHCPTIVGPMLVDPSGKRGIPLLHWFVASAWSWTCQTPANAYSPHSVHQCI